MLPLQPVQARRLRIMVPLLTTMCHRCGHTPAILERVDVGGPFDGWTQRQRVLSGAPLDLSP